MGRLFNKIVRKIIIAASGKTLAQELNTNGGKSGGECAIEGFAELLREAAADGCVLLKNENKTLPFSESDTVSVFGRVQRDYFYVGYGSGGDVKAPYSVNLIDGMRADNIKINETLAQIYKEWCEKPKNAADEGFWGHWPFAFPEMPLSEEVVADAAKNSDAALVVIGRAAGEDRENLLKKGSYYLTDRETDMLDKVTSRFSRVAVLLNCGNIIDMEWIEKYAGKIGAALYAWQGGMESGNAVADLLCGRVCPSGKLSDTVARRYSDYPSSANFGNRNYNEYAEDVYVGYRYFETFAKDSVLYPFGFGLSYTAFRTEPTDFNADGDVVKAAFSVTNIGDYPAKHTVQLYCAPPRGKLGKPVRVLTGFGKTALLKPGETANLKLEFPKSAASSYDDGGATGKKSCYVLEEGKYTVFYGEDCRTDSVAGEFAVNSLTVVQSLSEVCAVKPENAFKRLTAVTTETGTEPSCEYVPTATSDLKGRILSRLPAGVEMTGDKGYKLSDVAEGKITLKEFIAQLSTEELEAITRGEGLMNSPLGAVGNAGALGGVTESLRKKGVPPVVTTDGPAGIRLKKICALLPCGTNLACTWDTELIRKIHVKLGEEMLFYGSDVILSPGMNIHRNPLCGRNFEYFSEDPLLTGKMAAAVIRGVQSLGLSACPKHFACNNQETNRNRNDSRVSERALREIYLKGFEIAVKEARPDTVMTSYNKINGVWSHYNYELCTTVLRKEWGYEGMVMTDWWMRYAPSPEFPEVESNAYRVRAQADVLMPGGKNALSKSAGDDGTLTASLGKKDGITLGEIQRCAENVLRLALKSTAYRRFNKK